MIISETLFSMDGDLADLNGLRYLSQKYACILYLDEAHSFVLYGKNGYGFASDGNKNTNEKSIKEFINGLPVDKSVKKELLSLSPESYLGNLKND